MHMHMFISENSVDILLLINRQMQYQSFEARKGVSCQEDEL
jgi:hypothetical protein